MKYLSESVLSKMDVKRLGALRRSVLAHINRCEKDGVWCCENKCQWVEDKYHTYPNKNADYAYRDLINKYYDAQVDSLVALVELSKEDIRQGRSMPASEALARMRARRG